MQLSHKINFNLLVISFLEEYESMYQEASADVTKYLANPINAYLLVKRLTSDWRQVEGVMTQNVGPGILIQQLNFFHHLSIQLMGHLAISSFHPQHYSTS